MNARVVLITRQELPFPVLDDWRAHCASLAEFLQEPVELWRLDGPEPLAPDLAEALRALPVERREIVSPHPLPAAAPMSSAPFVWRADGSPDWAAMWSSFCDLALFGGPPHRGPDNPLAHGATTGAGDAGIDAVAEIRRGIWETTGLVSEPVEPGWLAVTCASRRMAAWLCAAIILENVEAGCEEERLLVPAEPTFTLHDQVKSVITVVAKTHHYWSAHVAASRA